MNERATAENIVPMDVPRGRNRKPDLARHRFKIVEFTNRGGSHSWRVSGYKRDGTRVRENFISQKAAVCRQIELEAEYQAREQPDSSLRATRLSDTQIRIAETAFVKLDADEELLSAVDYWLEHGRHAAVAESPRLDEAVKAFREWLETAPLRDHSKRNLRVRLNIFSNSVRNLRVADVTPEVIDGYLDKRNVGAGSKDNDRRAVSRFFSWCMDRKRRWATANPCAAVRVALAEKAPPAILTVDECERLLWAAEAFKDGRLVPYVAVCLFGALRPFEASRLTWAQVNLTDREIRLEANQTKTGTGRVVSVNPTLHAWLEICKGREFFPSNWRKDFDELKEQIGYGRGTEDKPDLKPWPVDVLRHTGISHQFRQTGSYGLTAELAGNSEAIIKAHYQGRVSSEDTKRFYAIKPRRS